MVNAELELTRNISKYLKITRIEGSRITGQLPEKMKSGKQKRGNPDFVLSPFVRSFLATFLTITRAII
jgi:hypothetical protein